MPTGYTADIKNGIDFETFVWGCARGMGALIMMRDLPSNAPIPERFEPSDYHLTALAVARAELARLQQIGDKDAEREASKAFDDEETNRFARIRENDGLREKYSAMLAKVVRWTPPSQEHEGFQTFMEEQLRQSISFDCNNSFYQKETVRMTGPEWKAHKVAEAEKDIQYHTEAHDKEVERVNSRNLWIKQLRESL